MPPSAETVRLASDAVVAWALGVYTRSCSSPVLMQEPAKPISSL